MVSNTDFENRLLEGEHYAQLAAEIGQQYGWATQMIVSNPLAAIHPQIPKIVTPVDEDDEKTPDVLFSRNTPYPMSFVAEVKLKAACTTGRDKDSPYFPIDDFRFDYGCAYQDLTGTKLIYVFHNEDHGPWLCASADKIRQNSPSTIPMPKSCGDPNKRRNFILCYMCDVAWFRPFETLVAEAVIVKQPPPAYYCSPVSIL